MRDGRNPSDARRVLDALRTPEVQANLAQSGAEPKGGTPAELVQQIRDESERWARVIREAGIKGE